MSDQTQPTIPYHVGIIMDGNRRWARAQGRPALLGHTAGVDRLEGTIETARRLGIGVITIYAFSTENWQRAEDEVGHLFGLIERYARQKLQKLVETGVRVRLMGQIDRLPTSLRDALADLVTATLENTEFTLGLCLSYGGRDEIIRAVKRAGEAGGIEQLNVETFRNYLDCPDLPDPELIIRTSGEQRLSNFLTWQSVYSELYFTETPWPAFDEQALQKALDWYAARGRRFGK